VSSSAHNSHTCRKRSLIDKRGRFSEVLYYEYALVCINSPPRGSLDHLRQNICRKGKRVVIAKTVHELQVTIIRGRESL